MVYEFSCPNFFNTYNNVIINMNGIFVNEERNNIEPVNKLDELIKRFNDDSDDDDYYMSKYGGYMKGCDKYKSLKIQVILRMFLTHF